MGSIYTDSEPQIVKRLPRKIKTIKTRFRIEKERQPGSRIDWKDPRNITAVVLACFGMSGAYVLQKTGLNGAKTGYRLRALGLDKARMDYRNGKGRFARTVLKENTSWVQGVIEDKAHRKLLK